MSSEIDLEEYTRLCVARDRLDRWISWSSGAKLLALESMRDAISILLGLHKDREALAVAEVATKIFTGKAGEVLDAMAALEAGKDGRRLVPMQGGFILN